MTPPTKRTRKAQPAVPTVPAPLKHGWSPALVAFLRGIALAALSAAIPAAISAIGDVTAKALLPYVPVLVLVLRQVEGIVDQARGQAPQVPLGGAPADPDAYRDSGHVTYDAVVVTVFISALMVTAGILAYNAVVTH